MKVLKTSQISKKWLINSVQLISLAITAAIFSAKKKLVNLPMSFWQIMKEYYGSYFELEIKVLYICHFLEIWAIFYISVKNSLLYCLPKIFVNSPIPFWQKMKEFYERIIFWISFRIINESLLSVSFFRNQGGFRDFLSKTADVSLTENEKLIG